MLQMLLRSRMSRTQLCTWQLSPASAGSAARLKSLVKDKSVPTGIEKDGASPPLVRTAMVGRGRPDGCNVWYVSSSNPNGLDRTFHAGRPARYSECSLPSP